MTEHLTSFRSQAEAANLMLRTRPRVIRLTPASATGSRARCAPNGPGATGWPAPPSPSAGPAAGEARASEPRANGLIQAAAWSAVPLGALGGGLAVESVGLTPTLVALGGVYLLVTLSPLLGGPWRGPASAGRSAEARPPTRPPGLLRRRR